MIYKIITLVNTLLKNHKRRYFLLVMVELLGDISGFFLLLFFALEYISVAWYLSTLVMILCNILKLKLTKTAKKTK